MSVTKEISTQIPPEVVEAAARAAYETPIPGASSWGEKPWEEVDGMLREYFVWQASAAIAASLNAWPGAHLVGDMGIYLPLHTENPNAES